MNTKSFFVFKWKVYNIAPDYIIPYGRMWLHEAKEICKKWDWEIDTIDGNKYTVGENIK